MTESVSCQKEHIGQFDESAFESLCEWEHSTVDLNCGSYFNYLLPVPDVHPAIKFAAYLLEMSDFLKSEFLMKSDTRVVWKRYSRDDHVKIAIAYLF